MGGGGGGGGGGIENANQQLREVGGWGRYSDHIMVLRCAYNNFVIGQ